MRKYIVNARQNYVAHAGSKARADIEMIAADMGLETIAFQGKSTAEGKIFTAVRLFADAVYNWKRLYSQTERGSAILLQYPHFPMKTSLIARFWIRRAQRKKGIRFIALIHDLQSISKVAGQAAVVSDRMLLPCFDICICHNEAMKKRLADFGFSPDRLVVLGIFDYITATSAPKKRDRRNTVIVAGHLIPEKAGYVYKLLNDPIPGIVFHLYGPGLEKEPSTDGIVYNGVFAPEELPEQLRGSFGLVWDGEEINTCAGPKGEYLRLNNPHKVSLYLASGIPVIIWKEAALAPFVVQNGLGIAVSSLNELPEALAQIDESQYEEMTKNAARWGERIRKGYFFRNAYAQALELLSKETDCR